MVLIDKELLSGVCVCVSTPPPHIGTQKAQSRLIKYYTLQRRGIHIML